MARRGGTMNAASFLLAAIAALALAACGDMSASKGDPERGAQLHDVCLDCHGTGPYKSPERKIKSRDALHKEVARWGDYYNPALSEQDVDDLVAYLDRDFYKF
jgi:mono/diheme cytochrome c family protein